MATIEKCFKELKKAEIIEELRELGLNTAGVKQELMDRLRTAFEEKGINIDSYRFKLKEAQIIEPDVVTWLKEFRREFVEKDRLQEEQRERERREREEKERLQEEQRRNMEGLLRDVIRKQADGIAEIQRVVKVLIEEKVEGIREEWKQKLSAHREDLEMGQKEIREEIGVLKEDSRQERIEVLAALKDVQGRTMQEMDNIGEETKRKFEIVSERILKCDVKIEQVSERASAEAARLEKQMQLIGRKETEWLRMQGYKGGSVSQIPAINVKIPQFDGRKGARPMRYMHELEEYQGLYQLTDGDMLKIIRQGMVGPAGEWMTATYHLQTDMENFKHLFLAQFWGKQHQMEVRRMLDSGQYNRNGNMSRVEYATKRISAAKELQPAMEDEEIIYRLEHHFGPEVNAAIITQHITALPQLLELLGRYDNAAPEQHRETRPEARQREQQEVGRYKVPNENRRGNGMTYQSRENQRQQWNGERHWIKDPNNPYRRGEMEYHRTADRVNTLIFENNDGINVAGRKSEN